MIDPDIIYAQIAVARNGAIPSVPPYHNMYEIALTAHWIAVKYNFPCQFSRGKLAEVAAHVVCREPNGPSPDLFLSYNSCPNEPDLEFGYSPDIYNALMLLTPSNRFYEVLCGEELI